MKPTAYLYDFQLDDETITDWTATDLKDLEKFPGVSNIRPLYELPTIKAFLWECCKSFGTTGEVVFKVFNHKVGIENET